MDVGEWWVQFLKRCKMLSFVKCKKALNACLFMSIHGLFHIPLSFKEGAMAPIASPPKPLTELLILTLIPV